MCAADFCYQECFVCWSNVWAEVFLFAHAVKDEFFFWKEDPVIVKDLGFVDKDVDED